VLHCFEVLLLLLLLLLFPASEQCLAVLLKVLQSEVPWATYCQLMAGSSKDHATAISTADFVRSLITGVSGSLVQCSSDVVLSGKYMPSFWKESPFDACSAMC
jgi:hypothetical protein